jgi:hypothetical protein
MSNCDGHNFALLLLLCEPRRRYAGGMDWTLISLIQFRPRQATVALAPGRPLRLRRSRGRRVACERGCVWITAPGEASDIFLHAGQHWTIPANGLVLVEAEGSAVVTLDC